MKYIILVLLALFVLGAAVMLFGGFDLGQQIIAAQTSPVPTPTAQQLHEAQIEQITKSLLSSQVNQPRQRGDVVLYLLLVVLMVGSFAVLAFMLFGNDGLTGFVKQVRGMRKDSARNRRQTASPPAQPAAPHWRVLPPDDMPDNQITTPPAQLPSGVHLE